jgi:hypothetical protein
MDEHLGIHLIKDAYIYAMVNKIDMILNKTRKDNSRRLIEIDK